jgi:DICT domain-containing protein
MGTSCPVEHAAVWDRAGRELDLVMEITERAVTDKPAELTRVIAGHREQGHAVALDDLGADVRSLALLPLIEPEVIKLDLRLVQDRPSTDQAAIVSAVAAERERSGALILAEGIETEQHLAVARSLGATLGQGWLWGRPGPLPVRSRPAAVARRPRAPHPRGRTPFEVVAAERDVAVASKGLLLPMSHHLEHRALRIGEGAVILSAFQDARHFTPATLRRYEVLARSASLVAAFGIGLPEEPAPGVRGASLEPGDALAGEWSVVVIGPHFAGALVGQDLGDTGPDRERRFAFATVYDRSLVVAAARTLVARVTPRVGTALTAYGRRASARGAPPGRARTRGRWQREGRNAWRGPSGVVEPAGTDSKVRLRRLGYIGRSGRVPAGWSLARTTRPLTAFLANSGASPKRKVRAPRRAPWGGIQLSPASGGRSRVTSPG